MNNNLKKENKPDYGIDAPKVVRNLLVGGIIGLLIGLSVIFNLWTGIIIVGPISGIEFMFPFGSIGFVCGFGFTAMALWMFWSSKVGKIRNREKLLNNISWKGNEIVLDVGCGRGLMLIGAAKRLDTGKAFGIDIWQSEDLSGNNIEATLENIKIENVEERVEVKTADMRQLPFADNTFDVIVSCSAIHNLYNKNDRGKAIAEIMRTLKPGGQILIDDIRFYDEYKSFFKTNGCKSIRKVNSKMFGLFVALITVGSMRPATIYAVKAEDEKI